MNQEITLRSLAEKGTALLLIVSLLGVAVLASSPELHKRLHRDADSPHHTCIITLFAKGQVAGTVSAPFPTASIYSVWHIPALLAVVFLPVADYRFSQGRAPPLS